MQGFVLDILLNYSIAIPALISAIRLKPTFSTLYPFIFFIWFGLINETLSLVLIYTTGSNAINANIYVLIEYLVILFQFSKWRQLNKRAHLCLTAAGICVWCFDNIAVNTLADNNSIFRSFYALAIVFLSIGQINRIMVYEKKSLLKNAAFLICIGLLLFFCCKAFVEVFNVFQPAFSDTFYGNLFLILSIANVLSNVIYSVAILWIPVKQEFTLPY